MNQYMTPCDIDQEIDDAYHARHTGQQKAILAIRFRLAQLGNEIAAGTISQSELLNRISGFRRELTCCL